METAKVKCDICGEEIKGGKFLCLSVEEKCVTHVLTKGEDRGATYPAPFGTRAGGDICSNACLIEWAKRTKME
jgi:hypothetical protein